MIVLRSFEHLVFSLKNYNNTICSFKGSKVSSPASSSVSSDNIPQDFFLLLLLFFLAPPVFRRDGEHSGNKTEFLSWACLFPANYKKTDKMLLLKFKADL